MPQGEVGFVALGKVARSSRTRYELRAILSNIQETIALCIKVRAELGIPLTIL